MKRIKIFQTIILYFFLLSLSVAAHALPMELPPAMWKKHSFALSGRASIFTTDANYDDDRGNFVHLPDDNSFSVIESHLKLRFNPTARISVFGTTGFANAKSLGTDLERANSMLTNTTLGLDGIVWTRWLRIIAEIEGGYPFQKVDPDSDKALNSDGLAFARAHLFFIKQFSSSLIFLHSGIKYRDEGIATLWNWGAGVEKMFQKKFVLGAEVSGFDTLINDELMKGERTQLTDRVNAGSTYFYAYEPSILEARAWAGFSTKKNLEFRIGYGQTLDGVRSAVGKTGFLSFTWNLDPSPQQSSFQNYIQQQKKDRHRSREALENFRVNTEKTDPDLFDAGEVFDPSIESPVNDPALAD